MASNENFNFFNFGKNDNLTDNGASSFLNKFMKNIGSNPSTGVANNTQDVIAPPKFDDNLPRIEQFDDPTNSNYGTIQMVQNQTFSVGDSVSFGKKTDNNDGTYYSDFDWRLLT